jgi:hypothetical protein
LLEALDAIDDGAALLGFGELAVGALAGFGAFVTGVPLGGWLASDALLGVEAPVVGVLVDGFALACGALLVGLALGCGALLVGLALGCGAVLAAVALGDCALVAGVAFGCGALLPELAPADGALLVGLAVAEGELVGLVVDVPPADFGAFAALESMTLAGAALAGATAGATVFAVALPEAITLAVTALGADALASFTLDSEGFVLGSDGFGGAVAGGEAEGALVGCAGVDGVALVAAAGADDAVAGAGDAIAGADDAALVAAGDEEDAAFVACDAGDVVVPAVSAGAGVCSVASDQSSSNTSCSAHAIELERARTPSSWMCSSERQSKF